jgi:short-subunit dehydrogenase
MFNKYLVTGTSSGLGEGLAIDLINNDENVIGLSTSAIENVEIINSPSYKHLTIDLSDLISVANIDFSDIILPSDKVCLIINAAQFTFDDSSSVISDAAIKLFNINYHSAVALIKLLKGNLKRVIFINSISGLNPQLNQSQYSASKHALQAYSEVLAKESIALGFDVMSLNPGGMDTPLWSKVNNNIDRTTFLQIDTVVATVKFMSRLPYKTYINKFSLLPSSDVLNN